MSDALFHISLNILIIGGVFILSLLWVYMACRMGGRAILRTYLEYKFAKKPVKGKTFRENLESRKGI